MRENDLLAPGRVGQPRGPRNHDGTIIPDTIDTMWGTDMTTTWTAEGQVAVLASHLLASAIDHHNARCVGIHAARHGTRFETLEPLPQGVWRHFGAIGKDVACGPLRPSRLWLSIHVRHLPDRDPLSRYLEPAFVGAPEGNGCAERFIRTLKENLLWIWTFGTVEDLRLGPVST